jgi:hypothetical protein
LGVRGQWMAGGAGQGRSGVRVRIWKVSCAYSLTTGPTKRCFPFNGQYLLSQLTSLCRRSPAMSRPPLPSVSSHDSTNAPYGDPFANRPRQTHFQEPVRPYESTSSLQRPFESSASLPPEGNYEDDDYVEKLPLTGGDTAGGFYPPG